MVLRLSPSQSISLVDWANVARFGCCQHPANSEIGWALTLASARHICYKQFA